MLLTGRHAETHTPQAMMTPDGLKDIATYAVIVAPWKNNIVPAVNSTIPAASVANGKSFVANATKAGLGINSWTFRDESSFLASNYSNSPQNELTLFLKDVGVQGIFTDNTTSAVQWLKTNGFTPVRVGVLEAFASIFDAPLVDVCVRRSHPACLADIIVTKVSLIFVPVQSQSSAICWDLHARTGLCNPTRPGPRPCRRGCCRRWDRRPRRPLQAVPHLQPLPQGGQQGVNQFCDDL